MNYRQKKVLGRLKATGYVSVVDQAKELHVTKMTIRRDLQMLEQIGVATRIHGGAIPKSELTIGLEMLTVSPRPGQVEIARLAIKKLAPASVVMLNTGTTVLQVAREIASSSLPLTVITNSIAVAVVLYKSEAQVLVTGGSLRRQALDLAGPIAMKNLDEYHVDTLVSGCDGADSEAGFFTADVNLAEMEKKAVEISGRVLVVAESFKFSRRSLAKFAEVDEVNMLITDSRLSPVDEENLRKVGMDVCRSKL